MEMTELINYIFWGLAFVMLILSFIHYNEKLNEANIICVNQLGQPIQPDSQQQYQQNQIYEIEWNATKWQENKLTPTPEG